MVLAGVTRDSILSLAAAHIDPSTPFKIEGLPDKLVVSQRSMNMAEVVRASEDGSLREMFGSGTAAIVSPIEMIGSVFSPLPLPIPLLPSISLTRRTKTDLSKISVTKEKRSKSLVDRTD